MLRVRVPRSGLRLVATACAVAGLAGCGAECHPVNGRLMFNNQPLTSQEGAVVLKPDASTGNKRAVTPMAVLQRDGSFSVVPNARPGPPAGWYKVIVTATRAAHPNEDARSLLNARLQDRGGYASPLRWSPAPPRAAMTCSSFVDSWPRLGAGRTSVSSGKELPQCVRSHLFRRAGVPASH